MRAILLANRGSSEAVAARLASMPDIELSICGKPEDVVWLIKGADALILQQSLYPGIVEQAACASPRLRWIQLLSAGYDSLLDSHLPQGAIVTNAGPSLAPAVADHALALLLSLTRRIPQAVVSQSRSTWEPQSLRGSVTLEGRTALIVGFGSIGRAIAIRLRSFGMIVLGVNRGGALRPEADRIYPLAQLDEALPTADVIMIALPQSPLTLGLFSRSRLERCKPGAYLVNVGRGAVVDLAALVHALTTGRLAGGGLDVTDPEPLPPDHPAWSTPGLLITPHTGGTGAQNALADFVARNMEAFLRGRRLEGQIEMA